jgi:hypothetical protein
MAARGVGSLAGGYLALRPSVRNLTWQADSAARA